MVPYSLQVWVKCLLKVMPLTAIVSTQADLRDDIWTLVQGNVSHNIRFLELELEYQP